MDSKLKRQVTFIVIIGALIILSIALIANATTIKEKLGAPKADVEISAVNDADKIEKTLTSDGFVQLGSDLYGWKNDETFFDSESDSLAMQILEDMSTLTIRATSVERDIRVRIMDYTGNLKKEIPFEVSIKSNNGKEDLTVIDEDMDGIVYISDLKAGRYEVSVALVDDWIIPEESTAVEVKDNVEYLMIEDIDVILKSEVALGTGADNAMVLSAVNDADKKITEKFGDDETMVYGIDVSSENGEIDWNQVYQSGIRFVMLRAGYRGAFSGDLITDDSFAEYAKEANRAGLDVGAYFYSQAINEREAVEEASALLLLTEQSRISYPLCIRVDMAGGMGRADEIDADTRTKIVDAFCKTVSNAGHEACFYATKNWLNTNLNVSKLDKNKIWLAEYRKIPTYEGYYDIWEYSCNGKVPGIDGNVNLNISFLNK